MPPFVLALLVFIAVFMALGLVYFGVMQSRKESKVKARVEHIEKDSSGDQEAEQRKLSAAELQRRNELTDSFKSRILVPLAIKLSDIVQQIIPTNGRSFLRKKLVQAGYPKPQHFKTFMGVQLIIFCVGVVGIIVFAIISKLPILQIIMWAPVGAALGMAFPVLWLVDKSAKRQKSIQQALPDFLDLLVISVEAGMGMDLAIKKIAALEGLGETPDFRNELYKYTGDINLGKSRKYALLDFADRIGLEDLNSVVGALVQAFEMGTGVAQTLRIQSDTLRSRRLFRAEANAAKVATKMVLPTYMFFFPAIFIVMLGPMIMDAVNKISGMMGGD